MMGSNSRGKDGEGTSGINRVYDDDDDSYECLQEMNFVPYETLLHSNMNTNGFVAPFVMQQESSLLCDMDKNDIDESFFDTNDIDESFFDTELIQCHGWPANNTKKLLASQSNGPHCWTFLSTAAYEKQNKVPQENIPTATATRVKEGMLEGVETALGLSKGSLPKPFYTKLQLWGAALPTNTPGVPCIFDPFGRAGICGDWLLGSNIEAAVLSGIALANHIADYIQSLGTDPGEFAVGLNHEFQPLEGHDIGQFPGLGSEEKITEAQVYELAK